MEPNFLDEECDVFISENDIKSEEKLKVRVGLKKLQTLNQKWWSYAINYEKIAWTKVKVEIPWQNKSN
jgi:hypothetical protein